jgi:hypothetical protein
MCRVSEWVTGPVCDATMGLCCTSTQFEQHTRRKKRSSHDVSACHAMHARFTARCSRVRAHLSIAVGAHQLRVEYGGRCLRHHVEALPKFLLLTSCDAQQV